MRSFISTYFGYILFAFCLLGFFVPVSINNVSYVILPLLFFVIFTSYFQLEFDSTLKTNLTKAIWFSVIRFLILPVILFFIIKTINEYYAFMVFYMLLLPVAVSSIAISGLYKGNASLSLLILVFSSFVATFTIPYLGVTLSNVVDYIDPFILFRALFLTVILPFLLHLPFRRINKVKIFMRLNIPVIAIVCLSAILVIAISMNREYIYQSFEKIPVFLGVAVLLYAALYFLGWNSFFSPQKQDRISFSVCSGLNNIGLGISISILYFKPSVTIFLIVAELVWTAVLIPLKYFFKNRQNQ